MKPDIITEMINQGSGSYCGRITRKVKQRRVY